MVNDTEDTLRNCLYYMRDYFFVWCNGLVFRNVKGNYRYDEKITRKNFPEKSLLHSVPSQITHTPQKYLHKTVSPVTSRLPDSHVVSKCFLPC